MFNIEWLETLFSTLALSPRTNCIARVQFRIYPINLLSH